MFNQEREKIIENCVKELLKDCEGEPMNGDDIKECMIIFEMNLNEVMGED